VQFLFPFHQQPGCIFDLANTGRIQSKCRNQYLIQVKKIAVAFLSAQYIFFNSMSEGCQIELLSIQFDFWLTWRKKHSI
jgi:hypothetical protein